MEYKGGMQHCSFPKKSFVVENIFDYDPETRSKLEIDSAIPALFNLN